MEQICDYNYMRYAGWNVNASDECYKRFMSKNIVNLISRKITELTKGVDSENRSIIVPNERICEVMDGVYNSISPAIGDIYTRYIVPNTEQEDRVQSMIDQTIEIIVSHIRNSLGIEQWNKSLTAWVQVYGDFNEHGLRQHSIIKTRERKPTTMMFNMNY